MFRTLSSKAATLAAGVALVSALFAGQPAHAQATLTITDSTCTGFTATPNGAGLTITCNGSTGGGGGGSAPSGCTASANPAGPFAAGGGATTVSVSCASGVPTSYSWSASPAVSGLQPTTTAGSQGPLTITQSTTFSVTPSNATGAGNVASVPVSVQTGGGGGGGAGLANCAAQGITVLSGNAINIPWGASQGGVTNSSGTFGNSVAWVFQMTVPAGTSNTSVSGSFQVAENGGQGDPRNVTISKTPCDFRAQDTSGASGPLQICRNGSTCKLYFQVGAPTFFGNFAGLSAGTTYYISVRNYDDFSNNGAGGYNCPGGNCPAVYAVQPTQ